MKFQLALHPIRCCPTKLGVRHDVSPSRRDRAPARVHVLIGLYKENASHQRVDAAIQYRWKFVCFIRGYPSCTTEFDECDQTKLYPPLTQSRSV